LILSDYSIHVDSNDQRTIVVAALARVRCVQRITTLPMQTAMQPASGADAQAIAEDFARASTQMIRATLQAARASQPCTSN
jgi:hypothetical protein